MSTAVGALYREQLVALARHAAVLDEVTFTWFGQRVRVPERAVDGVPAPRLATHLYAHFYTVGRPVPGGVGGPRGTDRMDEAFVEGIGAATSRAGPLDARATVAAPAPDARLVEYDGITFLAPAGPPGATDVRQPALLRRVQPGFCAVIGSAALTPGTEPLVRLYWNVVADGAAPLAGLLSRELEACGVPFVLKLRNAPAGFTRRDAAVLLFPGETLAATLDVVARRHRDLAWALLDGVPALTKRLAPGLGAAEDPGTGESFGQHRCRLLAAALCDPAVRRRRGVERRADAIAAHLQAAGVSPSAPYLGPGRADRLRLPVVLRRSASSGAGGMPRTGPSLQPLAAAAAIGDLLAREALWQGDACTWLTPRPGPDPSSLGPSPGRTWSPAGGDLFGGTAGIGTFLAHLAAAVDDAGYARAAVGALRHAADAAEHHLRPADATPLLGWTGIVAALLHAGRRLDRPELVDRGELLAKRLVRQELEGPGDDWLYGLAGTIAGLLAVGRSDVDGSADVDGPFTDVADRLGQVLLARSVLTGSVRTWPDRRWARVPLTGLAHGAAGIALAFAELAAATGRVCYRSAVADAVAYERRNYSPSRRNWPDFRPVPAGAGVARGRRFAVAWCHGAPGIALARMHTWRLLAEEDYRAEAALGRVTACRSLEWLAGAAPDQLVLCHGLAGNLRIVRILDVAGVSGAGVSGAGVDGAGVPGSPSDASLLEGSARQLCIVAGLARVDGPTSRWMRATPSLFTGAAGIGQALLGEAHVVGADWPLLPW